MEFRELKYFLAIAREESISKAAELLNTTQPNLSRQMHNLEDEIGRPLFVRGSRKISLTEAGILLRRRAQELVDLSDKTVTELTADREVIRGDINIGCGESDAVRLVAKAIKRTHDIYKEIKFNLFSGDAITVTERLDSGVIDFGVLINYDDMSKYDYIRLPLTDVWGILMQKTSPLSDRKHVKATDLRDVPLICSQQVIKNRNHIVTDWFDQSDVSPHVVATYNLIYNASLLVKEGIGYAITLDRLLQTGGDSDLCFRPLFPRLESHLDIAWKKYQVFPRAAEIFLENLRACLAAL